MYRPFNAAWLIFTFVPTVVVLITISLRRHTRKLPVTKPPFSFLWYLAAAQIILMIAIRAYDNRQLRLELRNIAPGEITNLNLRHDTINKPVFDKTKVADLVSVLQSVHGVAAHHSYRVENFYLSFDYRGNHFGYELGRDSQRPDEYWIIPTTRSASWVAGIEMGRVQSAKLGQLLDALLKDSP